MFQSSRSRVRASLSIPARHARLQPHTAIARMHSRPLSLSWISSCRVHVDIRRSYDSVQFLAHTDCEFKACNKNKGTAFMNYEIVSTKLKGMYACTSSDGKSSLIRTGWQGANACVCDNSQNDLNCQGVGPVQPVKPPLGTC